MSDFRSPGTPPSTAFFQHLVETTPDGVWLIDFDGRTIFANARVAEMHGIDEAELPRLSVYDVLDASGKESFAGHLTALRGGMVEHEDAESMFVRRDGSTQWMLVRAQLMTHPRTGEPCVLLRLSDFSRRRQERDDLARAQVDLEAARDAAMAASRQKSEFLATVSHEIRTPLNGVLGLNELLLDTQLDDEQRRLAAGAQQQGQVLLALINDLLDFSKIEAGRLVLEEVVFDVRTVLDQVVEPLRDAAHVKGIALSVAYDDTTPGHVRGDPTTVARVCVNLLSNALKFTESGSVAMQVSSEPVADLVRLRVSVTDTGIGIDCDAADIFAPFQQADSSTARVFGGTGLGLAISRELVESMGGEIEFESVVGRGSTFRFSALLAQVGEQPAPSAERVVARPTLRPHRVLVVEDNEVNQLVATGMLTSLGHVAEVAGDGLLAVEALAVEDYDLVLMDVQMPRLDGFGATARIRAAERPGKRTPIVAMTANAVTGERERCLAVGMDDFLTKPVNRDDLARALARWLGGGDVADSSVGSPAPAAVVSPQVLDHSRLDELGELGEGDAAYVDRVLERFTTTGPALVAAVQSAGTSGELAFAAHKLAGTAGNLGLEQLAALARRLEVLAESEPDAARTMIADLRPALDAAIAALTGHRAGLVGRVGLEPTAQGL